MAPPLLWLARSALARCEGAVAVSRVLRMLDVDLSQNGQKSKKVWRNAGFQASLSAVCIRAQAYRHALT
jgi:hypothetical protein